MPTVHCPTLKTLESKLPPAGTSVNFAWVGFNEQLLLREIGASKTPNSRTNLVLILSGTVTTIGTPQKRSCSSPFLNFELSKMVPRN